MWPSGAEYDHICQADITQVDQYSGVYAHKIILYFNKNWAGLANNDWLVFNLFLVTL